MSVTVMTAYDAVGVKEDVSDVISNISPTKTPFQSSLRSEKISQKVHIWQEDALDAAADNAAVEGADAAAAAITATSERQNNTQILTKTVKVTGTMDATATYGRAKESAYQMSKKMAEIKRDLEVVMVGYNRNYTAGTSSTARKMASAFYMIDSGNVTAAGTADLTEEHVLDAMENLYDAGGEATTLMIKPSDSLIVANFVDAGNRTRTFNDGQMTLTNAVRVYVSPFGEVKVVLNRFILATAALVYDPSNWRQLTLRPWFREVLAKTGDSLNQQIVGEFSLKHNNFKASASITGLN